VIPPLSAVLRFFVAAVAVKFAEASLRPFFLAPVVEFAVAFEFVAASFGWAL
jgi:hypothetical protein